MGSECKDTRGRLGSTVGKAIGMCYSYRAVAPFVDVATHICGASHVYIQQYYSSRMSSVYA